MVATAPLAKAPRAKAPSRSRKSDILAAAQREFATGGFSGARIERIAAAARVNKQLLFHYFHSKEGLFLSALEELLARCEPASGSPDQPAEEIRRIISALQQAVHTLPGVLGIVADSAANAEFPQDAASAIAAWRHRLLARLKEAVEEGQRRGFFRDDIDPSAVSQIAFAGALGSGTLTGNGAVPVATMVVDYCAWR